MGTLVGRVYFTDEGGDYMGFWDSEYDAFAWRTINDPALEARLPLAEPNPGIYEAGAWMQLADGRMLQRIDENNWGDPTTSPYCMAIVWDADLTVSSAVGWTQPWLYDYQSARDTTYIAARYGFGCVVKGKNWLTWQTPTLNGEAQASYGVFAADGTRTDSGYWPPYSSAVEGWGSSQVYHSDGFIYRSVNTDDQFDRFNPDTGVFEATGIVNSAVDPNLYRWHTLGFAGFTANGEFVVTDGNASDLNPPAENGKSPGLFKVYDHTLFPWNDVALNAWEPYDGPPVRYFTPTPPEGVEWNYLGPESLYAGSTFIVDNRIYFSVRLMEAVYPDQYPVGPNDLRYGYDDLGNGLGNAVALYSVDLDTWAMELEFLVPHRLLMPDGSVATDPNAAWYSTADSAFMGMAYMPGSTITGNLLGDRRRFVP